MYLSPGDSRCHIFRLKATVFDRQKIVGKFDASRGSSYDIYAPRRAQHCDIFSIRLAGNVVVLTEIAVEE